MDVVAAQCIRLFEEIRVFLAGAGEKPWSQWAGEQARKFEEAFSHEARFPDKRYLVKEALAQFGGNDTFSDLFLCEQNGHKISNLKKDNKKLENLRNLLYAELEKLQKS